MKQKHGRKSKIAALLAACALTVSAMIAGGTLSVSADAGEAKENVGGIFLISGGTAANGDYSYDENNSLLTILKSTPITIKSVDNQYVNAKIFIKNGVDANITLDTLRIRPTDGAAISMGDSSASVTITIKGGTSNYLSGVNAAGIEKLSKNGRLTITCEHADEENHQCSESCGLLDARCGQGHGAGIGTSGCNYGTETGGIYIKGGVILAVGHDGAGIGGSNLADVSDINISGGIIEARGDNGAAGIGSATNGGIDSINISGGIISAYGSAFRNYSGSHFYGAAIGAAYCSRFDSINISGGTIYANTAYDSNGTGAVAVGAGNNCNSDRTGIIRISDGVVYAVGSGSTDAIGVTDSVAKPADIVIDGGSVYPKCGDKCTVHSGKIGMSSLPKDSSGRELILLEIDNSGNESITVNGKAYPSNSTYNTAFDSATKVDKSYVFMPKSGRNSVTVGNTTTEYIYTESGLSNAENMKLDFYAADSNKPLVYGTDYKIDGSTLKILSDKGITIKNVDPTQPCSNNIYIESGVSANITFAGINIQRGLNELSAVEIAENSSGNVNIILADNTDNIISTTYNYAALSKNSDSDQCGTLTISCQHSGEAGHICGSSCGGLNAASSTFPAAIGGDDNKSASNIAINGGRINAKGSKGAGIGGGYNAKANNITVNGGIINAESVFGAAIGGGQYANGTNIRIENSILYAASQSGAAIIGGGVNGTGDKIYIENSVVSLVQKGSCGSDMIGNGVDGVASEIYIDNSSVAMYSTSTVSPDISQNSQIKNSAGEPVYLLTVDNPNGDEVIVDGVKAIAANNIAADPNDTGLHLWLADRDHSLTFTDADGTTTQIDYHFNDLFKVFKLCEADVEDGYRYNETAHWYICKNSDLCTVKFNYQNHLGGNATCTNKAICKACGVEYGDPLGHNMQYFDYVPETCTTDGYLPYYYCDRCDKYFGRETDSLDTELNVFIIPATGHDMTKVDAVPASCEADGNIEYYKCGYCGKFFSDADGKNEITATDTVIAAAGHRYLTSWTFDSDSHWHKCDVCGSADTIEPHVSSGQATETAAETCTICGYEIAPMLGHIHADNLMPVYAVKPTCTKDGNIDYYVCSCGRLFADSNAEATLSEADIVIPAAGHGATEIRNRVEPTETANGYTGDEYCTVCNELVKRGTVIPTTAPSETTPTPSENPTAPSETTPTPSETPTAPSETTPTAPSETTPTPSETSAATTFPPENAELPFIKDEDGKTGWEVINSRLADTDEGGRVIVEMNGSTDVHEETFALIKGKDITLVLDMGNGFSWEINGNDVDSPKNVNLSVTPDADIPVKVINRLTGECYCTSFTLEYSGEFGFIAKLSMGLGKENKGLYANLYYYLGDGEFEFIGSAKVNSEGVAKLSLSHASDYVVIVDETDHAADNESGDAEKPESGETDHAADNESGDVEKPESGETNHAVDNESGDAEKPESNETNHGTGVVVFGLIAVIILAAAVTVVLSRKKKQK